MIDIDPDQITIPLVWSQLFDREAPTDVEIGCGKGKFLNELATSRPERNILAIERSGKYHKLCCDRATRRGLTNIRAMRTTGEDLLFRLLAESSVENFYVLFSDPWPKKRHHKRRFFKPENIIGITRALIPGGRLMVKSDHNAYSEVITEFLTAAPGLASIDASEAFSDLPITGFEHKYRIEGRTIHQWALVKS